MGSQKPDLPDPTADLHWSAFRGVIQDIFTANAEAHPDRLCVVENSFRFKSSKRVHLPPNQ
jgi:L-2-aminoadipate reductase